MEAWVASEHVDNRKYRYCAPHQELQRDSHKDAKLDLTGRSRERWELTDGLWFFRGQKRVGSVKGGLSYHAAIIHPLLTEHLLCAALGLSANLTFQGDRRAEGRAGGHHRSPLTPPWGRCGVREPQQDTHR